MASSTPKDQAPPKDQAVPPEGQAATAAPSAAARAAAKRAADGVSDEERKRLDIDALLAERRGYLQRGLDDRVKGVDQALARLDHKA
jgi:hypothetical protein